MKTSNAKFASARQRFYFKRLPVEELRRYSRQPLVALASALASGVQARQYERWGQPGSRAQLLDIKSRKLEMDFVIESDASSIHVLNAVSPGWTCSLPFANYVVDRIEKNVQ